MPETLPGIESPCRISTAEFSACGRFRYKLHRRWQTDGDEIAFIGCNPSTADAEKNDPTVTRCISYAVRWGYSGFWMLNAFAWRDTNPKALYQRFSRDEEIIGGDNDDAIAEVLAGVKRTICCWGVHGAIGGRDLQMLATVLHGRTLHCLGRTKGGHCRHPLYLRNATKPEVYR